MDKVILLPEGWRVEMDATHLIAVAPNGGRVRLWTRIEHERMTREVRAINNPEGMT